MDDAEEFLKDVCGGCNGDYSQVVHESADKQQDDEIDPLDAFMADIDKTVEKVNERKREVPENDGDDGDEELNRMVDRQQAAAAGASYNFDTVRRTGEDDDDRAVLRAAMQQKLEDAKAPSRTIEALDAVDHATRQYGTFRKNIYTPHADVSKMSISDVINLRQSLDTHVFPYENTPAPVVSWSHFGFDSRLFAAIRLKGFAAPTPIQSQAVPLVMSGYDVLGVAQTGSDQPAGKHGQGPAAIIMAPTRELVHQIYKEASHYAKPFNLIVEEVYGGVSKYEQHKALKFGRVDIVVAAPGRAIDLVRSKGLELSRVTYVVLDEADKMFDLGFEPQVRSILGQIRPDRQTLLFSATFKKSVEVLARDVMTGPVVRVNIGRVTGQANTDITQDLHVFTSNLAKADWALVNVPELIRRGSVLIFVSMLGTADLLATTLRDAGVNAASLHGNLDQTQRNQVMKMFKTGAVTVLVATDVAARGLDVTAVKTVVQYEPAKDRDTYIHRIGRTGRAGATDGLAITLFTEKDVKPAGEICYVLQNSGLPIPEAVMDLANRDNKFRSSFRASVSGIGSNSGKMSRAGVGSTAWTNPQTADGGASRQHQSLPRQPAVSKPTETMFGGMFRKATFDDE